MTVRDLFGLAVRLTGFAFIILSLFDFLGLIMILAGLQERHERSVASIVAAGLGYLVLGALLLAGAKPFTRLVYGRP